MFFTLFKGAKNLTTDKSPINNCVAENFTAAIADFSLAHTELTAFRAALKIQEVVERSTELAAASQEIAATSQEVSASTQEISASMYEVKADAENNISRINNLEHLTGEVQSTLEKMTDSTGKLANRIKNIDVISQNVSEIADQTNLLSLNAAIEAARAGEHGRGFSVVAEEVRKLAGQTKSAVNEVKTISEYINNEAGMVGTAVTGVDQVLGKYISEVDEVSDRIRHSLSKIEESTEASESIASAMQQQASVTDNLAKLAQDLTESANFVDVLVNDSNRLNEIVTGHIKFTPDDSPVGILAARLVDHGNFLRKTITQAGKNADLPDHHQCSFGKWYDQNYDRYKHLKEFQDIEEPHRRVHEAALMLSREKTVANADNIVSASTDILESFVKLRLSIEK